MVAKILVEFRDQCTLILHHLPARSINLLALTLLRVLLRIDYLLLPLVLQFFLRSRIYTIDQLRWLDLTLEQTLLLLLGLVECPNRFLLLKHITTLAIPLPLKVLTLSQLTFPTVNLSNLRMVHLHLIDLRTILTLFTRWIGIVLIADLLNLTRMRCATVLLMVEWLLQLVLLPVLPTLPMDHLSPSKLLIPITFLTATRDRMEEEDRFIQELLPLPEVTSLNLILVVLLPLLPQAMDTHQTLLLLQLLTNGKESERRNWREGEVQDQRLQEENLRTETLDLRFRLPPSKNHQDPYPPKLNHLSLLHRRHRQVEVVEEEERRMMVKRKNLQLEVEGRQRQRMESRLPRNERRKLRRRRRKKQLKRLQQF